MNDDTAYELTRAINQLANNIGTQNERQDEANNLMRSLIEALNGNSQELFEARKKLDTPG